MSRLLARLVGTTSAGGLVVGAPWKPPELLADGETASSGADSGRPISSSTIGHGTLS